MTPDGIRLAGILEEMSEVAVAVSGGVDSMTLAVLANRVLGPPAAMYHAVSPAVPAEATQRVRDVARAEGWRMETFDAGEFADGRYRANPAHRCFFCKINLYGTIRSRTRRQILSGTNTDDLGEFRPGLDAARAHQVRHPYVEAGMDKPAVRRLSASLGLGEIAELPAAPCLSSRVETGIRIEPAMLGAIHAAEKLVAATLAPLTVRCRMRAAGVVVELDAQSLGRLTGEADATLRASLAQLLMAGGVEAPISFAPYRTGSAFLRATP